MDSARRYSFNLPWGAVVIGALGYAALSIWMIHLAEDFAGVIFFGLITLGAMFACLAFIMMTRRLAFPRVLELAEDAVLFPHGFPWTRIARILYADIIRISESSDRAQGCLSITTARGSFQITVSYLNDIESYRAVKDFICTKTSIIVPRYDKREPSDWRIWGFPEPILRWTEPKEWPRYRTHIVTSKPLLPRLAKALWFFVRCFGLFLLPWLLLQLFQLPTITATGFLWLCIPITLFFTSLHWLNAAYPVHTTEISCRDNGITQFFGKQTADWNYHQFSGWAVIERQFEGSIIHIMVLKGSRRVLAFALPDTSIRDRLVELFHGKKIPQSPDLKPSWEARP
jgi:hypothetical protein